MLKSQDPEARGTLTVCEVGLGVGREELGNKVSNSFLISWSAKYWGAPTANFSFNELGYRGPPACHARMERAGCSSAVVFRVRFLAGAKFELSQNLYSFSVIMLETSFCSFDKQPK